MEGAVESNDDPVLVAWRGTDEAASLVLTDEMAKYEVETQMDSLLQLAGCAIGMVLAAVPQWDRERMSQVLAWEAQRFADEVLDPDLQEEEVVQ